MRLTDFAVLSFDCYGTLIDWESGLANALAPLALRAAKAPAPEAILEAYAAHEAAQERATPTLAYPAVLGLVYRRLADDWDVAVSDAEVATFAASVPDWPAFPDSAEALAYLKRHFRLVILSNVDRASFRGSNARLGVDFDAVYTAEEIGSYKPDPRNFQYLIERVREDFGLDAGAILHTAQSLYHDHVPAQAIGLASAFIDRRHAEHGFGATLPPAGTPRFDFRFESLAALAEAHRNLATSH